MVDAGGPEGVERGRELLGGAPEDLAGEAGLGVEGDDGADDAGQGSRVAARRAAGRVEVGEGCGEGLGARVPRRDEAVAPARGQREHAGPERGDPDRDPAGARRRPQLAVARRVVAALEVHAAVAEERDDDPQRLLEAAHQVVGREAERLVLRQVRAAAEPEDQPAVRDLVQRGGHLGQDRRVAEGRRGHERRQADAAGRLRQRGEERPRLPRPARLARRDPPVGRAADEQVIRHEQAVEADGFRLAGERTQLGPARQPRLAEPALERLQEQSETHASSPPFGRAARHRKLCAVGTPADARRRAPATAAPGSRGGPGRAAPLRAGEPPVPDGVPLQRVLAPARPAAAPRGRSRADRAPAGGPPGPAPHGARRRPELRRVGRRLGRGRRGRGRVAGAPPRHPRRPRAFRAAASGSSGRR